jgi:hypothetical protein
VWEGPPRLVQPPFLNVDNRCSTSTIVAFLTALPIAYFGGRALAVAVAEPRYTPISAGQSTSQRRFRNHPSSLVRGADPVCAGCAIPLRPQPHDGVVKFAFICPGTNRSGRQPISKMSKLAPATIGPECADSEWLSGISSSKLE